MQFDLLTTVPLLTIIGFVAVELLLLLSTGLDLLDTPPQLPEKAPVRSWMTPEPEGQWMRDGE